MKNLRFISMVLFALGLVLGGCYSPLVSDENISFLISSDIKADGRWGRAIAVIDDTYALVGESNMAVERGGVKYAEAGRVLLLKVNSEGQWEIAKDESGKLVAFTSSDCVEGDAFGSSLYYGGGSSRLLFVSSLMADPGYDGIAHDNDGAVYVFKVPSDLSETNLPIEEAKLSLDFGVDDVAFKAPFTTLQDYLPFGGAVAKNDEISTSKVNAGIGFGRTVRYDESSEVLVIGAPYESYYKDLQENNNYILMRKVGAAYVFKPTASGDFKNWTLQNRLMPEWNYPEYITTKYYLPDGTYAGLVAEPTGSFVKDYNDRNNYLFGDVIAINGDTVAIGVRDAVFQYFRRFNPEPLSSGAKYVDSLGNVLPDGKKPYKYEERNDAYGTVYVYRNDGSNNFEFKQRLDRRHSKDEYAKVIPGTYLTDVENDDYYKHDYYFEEQLGASVEIFGDTILAGVPLCDGSVGGVRGAGLTRTNNDIGAIVFFEKVNNEACQLSDPNKMMKGENRIDWPQWGKSLIRHGDVLAVGAPGFDYGVLQKDVGAIWFYNISADGSSLTVKDKELYTTKELYKGEQRLGSYMDFSDKYLICGDPDFDLPIYYNNPVIESYTLENCGAIYTFTRK